MFTYKILKSAGEEAPKGNVAFEQLEKLVNEHIQDGWQPVGGIAVSSICRSESRWFHKRQLVRVIVASYDT